MARRKNNLRALACLPLVVLVVAARGARTTASTRDESASNQTAADAARDSEKRMNRLLTPARA